MNASACEFDISRATDAGTLHAYAADIRDDDTLHSDEKDGLLKIIGEKFGALNAAAIGKPKPRW